ncbi:MAG: tetratricopeptide repeat protein, partial [Candidatus Sericytochromatia bacterium]
MSASALKQAHQLLFSGQIAAAAALFASVQNQPDWEADALNGLGLCAEARGDLPMAEGFYRSALASREEAEYLNNLAICLLGQERPDAGLAVFARLIALDPPPEAWYNMILALVGAGRPWDALELLRPLLARHPRLEQPVQLLQQLVHRLGAGNTVSARLSRLAAAEPAEPVYQLALGAWYSLTGQATLAMRHNRSALLSNPALVGAYRPLIDSLRAQNRYGPALEKLRELFNGGLDLEAVAELLITLQQPVVDSEQQIEALREEMLLLLDSCAETVSAPHPYQPCPYHPRPYHPQVIPFYHTYQSGQDRPLQDKLAAFFARLLPRYQVEWRPNPRPRLGIVSVHLYRNPVTDLLARALETLLQSKDFETYLLPFEARAAKDDELSRRLQTLADQVVRLPPDLTAAAAAISRCNLDLLIYSDIGMETDTFALALSRLARYQVALPGHPVTSGSETIDYFVSAEALEAPGGDANYSEKLIRLPGLPDYHRPLPPPPASRDELGLPAGHLYFCPMTPFKLIPAFDRVLAGILAADPDARLLLLEYHHHLHQKLQRRFTASYPPFADRLHFLPWSPQPVFYQRLRAVDVILDTFPFGGGNTSYQALGLGCPIVC